MISEHEIAKRCHGITNLSNSSPNPPVINDASIANSLNRNIIGLKVRLCNDKRAYIVNLFPRYQEDLPQNIFDVWHRARDIIHTHKTGHMIYACPK
jgi:hypothetical protein